jgi:peroxiredoxin
MGLKVGDVAPDFTIQDHNGKEAHLADFRGKKVVLGFHPFAWTLVCAQQMQDLEASARRLEKANAIAFGISIDTTFSKHAWAKSLGIEETRLLSDFWPHGEVADAYGLFESGAGRSERAVVILDEKGVVRWMKIYPVAERPDIEEIMKEVEKI